MNNTFLMFLEALIYMSVVIADDDVFWRFLWYQTTYIHITHKQLAASVESERGREGEIMIIV